jgi:hypothetical protein
MSKSKRVANTDGKIRSRRRTVRSAQSNASACRIVERAQDKGDTRTGLRQSLSASRALGSLKAR